MSKPFNGFMLLFLAFIFERASGGFLPTPFPLMFIGANAAAFIYYYVDKTRAIKQDWRIPASTLHFVSLIGAWYGAYIAQKLFHHKNKKASFLLTYKLTALINCTAITLYAVPNSLNFIITKLNVLLR